ncbi:MAG: hypothetical protein WC560_03735 [Syntrophales bacterium]
MNKAKALGIVNPILGLMLIIQATTGLSNEILPNEFFEFIHVGGGIALLIVATIHVILNWEWIKTRYLKRTKKNT